MSTLRASSFLPLLLLAWLPAGLTQQCPVSSLTINVSELSSFSQCRLQVACNSTADTVEQFIDRIENMTEKKVEIHFLYEKNKSAAVNETQTATFTCEMRTTSRVEAGTNKTQQESHPEMSPTSTPEMSPTSTPEMSLTSTPEPQTKEGIIHTYIIPGLVVSSLFFLFCILVCLCRRSQRNAKGKSESKHVAEMNQLSTTQNEEVVYAKMKFEKTEIKPAASEVVYAEIKSQQK